MTRLADGRAIQLHGILFENMWPDYDWEASGRRGMIELAELRSEVEDVCLFQLASDLFRSELDVDLELAFPAGALSFVMPARNRPK